MKKSIGICISIFSLLAHRASAHVAYVTPPDTLVRTAGIDFHFLLSPLGNINYGILLVSFLLLIGSAYYLGHHIPLFIQEFAFIKKRLQTYSSSVPWILRLGLGIAVLGAGLHGVLISPVAPTISAIAAWEIIAGFSLLVGFLVTPSLLAIVGFYIAGALNHGYSLGNLEIVGTAVALFLLASSRPGFDDIVGIPMPFRNTYEKVAPLVLRITLGGTFIFLAFYEKIFNPHYFGFVVDNYNLQSLIHVSPAMWTLSVGVIELIIGLAILLGFKTRISSAIASIIFICTYFFFKEAVYSHVAIFASLSALFILGGGMWSIDEHLERKNIVQKRITAPRTRATVSKISSKKTTVRRVARKPI